VAELIAKNKPLKGRSITAVPVLTVLDKDKKLVAILFGYACHPTTLSFTKWCGDYPGFARSPWRRATPAPRRCSSNTCGGDQNPLPRRKVELCEKYGKMLADAVEAALKKPNEDGGAGSGPEVAFAHVDLPYEKVMTKKDLLAAAKEGNANQDALGRAADQEARWREVPVGVRVPAARLAAGQGHAVRRPGAEAVVDYALRFKAKYGKQTWVCGYATTWPLTYPHGACGPRGVRRRVVSVRVRRAPRCAGRATSRKRIAGAVEKLVKEVRKP